MQRLLEIAIISVSVIYVLMHAMEKHVQPLLVTTALLILAAVFKQRVVFAFAFALLLNYLTFNLLESFTDKESSEESSEESKKESSEESKKESSEESSGESSGIINGEFTPNIMETLKTAYENMTPEQIEHMTKDTKELMTSQKQLIETLQTMTPIVKEGMKMMEMFNNLKKKN
jgi:flagellar biosynthesis component FlhA